MNFAHTRFQARKYREGTDEGDAGEGTGTTVLTGGEGSEADDDKSSGEGEGSEADGEASGDDKTGDDEAGKEGSDTVPDTYADFGLPEGMEVDALALDQATPIFKELGLTQVQAQSLVDFYATQVQAGSEKQIDDFNQLMKDWREQGKNDKEIGGEKYDENIKLAHTAIAKYGTPELKQLLEDHGVGNHPELIRFMVKVGRTLKEDVPGDGGNAPAGNEDRATLLYGNNQSE